MTDALQHAQLMDQTYRYQRLIYDLTRKYYLLGRDHLIEEMDVQPGACVLEIACGTGRNLAMIHKRYPEAQVFGFDISDQMLTTARAKLDKSVSLAHGDACQFDPMAMFGIESFDHIVLSYSLSMIPNWTAALTEATRHLAPGGRLYVVDFGDSAGLPRWFQRGLLGWLARFHVAPRTTLETAMRELAQTDGTTTFKRLYRRYSVYGCYTKSGS